MIGKTTVGGLQSGLVYGFAGQVDGIVRGNPRRARRVDDHVIATGGLAEPAGAALSSTIEAVDPFLTLDGLRPRVGAQQMTPFTRAHWPCSRSRRSPSWRCRVRRGYIVTRSIHQGRGEQYVV